MGLFPASCSAPVEKEVRAALHLWWSTAQRTCNEISLDKATYFAIYKLLFKALAKEVGDKYDEEEALECAEEDFANDSPDGQALPREAFLDSLVIARSPSEPLSRGRCGEHAGPANLF